MEWKRYETKGEDGKEYPYWYHEKLGLSTWDSPTLILTSLILNGSLDANTLKVISWESLLEGTPFIKVKLREGKKEKFVFVHRGTKQVLMKDPFA